MSAYLKDPRYIYAYPVFMWGLCKMNKEKAFIPTRLLFLDLLLSALITSNPETGGQLNKSFNLQAAGCCSMKRDKGEGG